MAQINAIVGARALFSGDGVVPYNCAGLEYVMTKNPSRTTKVAAAKRSASKEALLPTFSNNLVLVRKNGKPVPENLLPRERVNHLLGISRDTIFHSRLGRRVDAYSVDPDDPSKIVRERADGTRTIGRLVGGRFRGLRVK
jgi:hypothetical protein